MEDKELKEESFEKKKSSNKKVSSLVQKVMNTIIWVILLGWISICVTDFIRTQNLEKPMFCIKEETVQYNDGDVYICTGLGYKVFHYNRASFTGVEYGPFWSKDRSAESE